MPEFAYIALTAAGSRTRGVRTASDLQAAAGALRAEGLFVIELAPAAGIPASPGRRSLAAWLADGVGWPIRTADRVQFLRQLGLMLRSGLPLLHALEVFAGQCSHTLLKRAVLRTADRIRGGMSLSAALERQGSLLPPLALRMIAVGETIGELETTLERMAAHLERRADIRNSLLTSLAYPVLLVLMTVGVVVFLVTRVIPRFVQLLSIRNVAMPAATQGLIAATEFLNRHGLLIAAAFAGAVIALLLLSLIRPVRYAVDRTLLGVPILGTILTLSFLAHFGRTMAALLKSGVPLLDALRTLGHSVGNRAMARRVQAASESVLAGRSLSEGLRCRVIPPLLSELVAVGEVSGTLETVLEDAADFYETRLQRTVKWMAGLFEPAMILIVGGIVGFVYIAFFSVLYRMSGG